jgi:hypothetical protein
MSGSINLPRHPSNLYRDDEFKTTIQHFRFQAAQKASACCNPSMAPLASKGGVAQGIVACDGDGWGFKSGSTKTVSLRRSTSAKAPTPSAAKATGISKVTKKTIKKSVSKASLSKFKDTGKASKSKKSVAKKSARKTPTMAGKASHTSTSNVNMATYKKMLAKKK